MKRIIISESEKSQILNLHSNLNNDDVIITDWLSPDEKYVIFLDELYDITNKRKLGNIWENFDNLKFFLQHSFNVSNFKEGVSSSIFEFGDYSSGKNSLWPTLNLTMIDKLELTSTTIDSLVTNNNIDVSQYDFWILDLQGAELVALKGAEKAIEKCKFILAEISQDEVYKNGVLYPDLKRFLEAKGFFPLYESKKIHDDVLFVRQ